MPRSTFLGVSCGPAYWIALASHTMLLWTVVATEPWVGPQYQSMREPPVLPLIAGGRLAMPKRVRPLVLVVTAGQDGHVLVLGAGDDPLGMEVLLAGKLRERAGHRDVGEEDHTRYPGTLQAW